MDELIKQYNPWWYDKDYKINLYSRKKLFEKIEKTIDFDKLKEYI